MKWNLLKIEQVTHNRFLNYFVFTYQVDRGDGVSHQVEYYLCSRHSQAELVALSKNYARPDGVLIPLYYIDPKDGSISLLMTHQFRPALGAYMESFPAGLMDPSDPDCFATAKREALEESGAEITDMELLCSPSATSSGLGDELDAVVLARIVSLGAKELEPYEDITTRLVPLKDALSMLDDPAHYHVPLATQLMIRYLGLRFQSHL